MLTRAQLDVIKAGIQSRPALWFNDTQQVGNDEVAEFYNSVASPAVPIWRPDVSITQLNSAIAWADMVALSVEKQLTYQSMVWSFNIDMTDAQVRNGIDAIFGNPSTSRTGILAVGKRNASYFEALFATGGATKVSTQYNNRLTAADVAEALFGA